MILAPPLYLDSAAHFLCSIRYPSSSRLPPRLRSSRMSLDSTSTPPESVQSSKYSLAHIAPLESILFDVDGTLCDSDAIHFVCFAEMLKEVGFNGGVPITEDFYAENMAGKHNEYLAKHLFPDWDLEKGMDFLNEKEAMFRRLTENKVPPVSGLYKLRKWIEDHGFKRAAVTNAPRLNAELMISSLGLTDFFQDLIIGGECERAKPFPDPYLKGLEAINASASHTLIFEDSASGTRAGIAAGMPVVALAYRNPEHLLREAGATLIVKDFEDPKLWEALEELERAGAVTKGTTD